MRLGDRAMGSAFATGEEQSAGLAAAAVFEALTDLAVILLDAEGRILAWNTGAEQITGRDRTAAIGKDYLEAPFTRDSDVDKLVVAREAGRFEVQAPRVRKDGVTISIHETVTPLR